MPTQQLRCEVPRWKKNKLFSSQSVVHFNSRCHASSEYRKYKFEGVSGVAAVANLENKRKCKEIAVAQAKKPKVRRADTERGVPAYGRDYSDDLEPRTLEILEKLKWNRNNWESIRHLSKGDESFYQERSRDMLLSDQYHRQL